MVQRAETQKSVNSLYKKNMMRAIAIIFLLLITSLTYAQKVYSVDYQNQADVKVYVVKYENQADLKVYKVKYSSQVGKNDGKWYFTDYSSQADKKIYFVDYENQADVKIYFVDYENQAGWRNKSKIQYFYWYTFNHDLSIKIP